MIKIYLFKVAWCIVIMWGRNIYNAELQWIEFHWWSIHPSISSHCVAHIYWSYQFEPGICSQVCRPRAKQLTSATLFKVGRICSISVQHSPFSVTQVCQKESSGQFHLAIIQQVRYTWRAELRQLKGRDCSYVAVVAAHPAVQSGVEEICGVMAANGTRSMMVDNWKTILCHVTDHSWIPLYD